MLVILEGTPVAAPGKSPFDEQLVTQVGFVYLVREGLFPVYKGCRIGRKNRFIPNIRILQRVDVHGETQRVLGKGFSAGHRPVIETGCVVGGHRYVIRPSKIVNQADAPDGIPGRVQLPEDGKEVIGNQLVANELPDLHVSFEVNVGQPEIAQFLKRNGCADRITDAPHARLNFRRYAHGYEKRIWFLCDGGRFDGDGILLSGFGSARAPALDATRQKKARND